MTTDTELLNAIADERKAIQRRLAELTIIEDFILARADAEGGKDAAKIKPDGENGKRRLRLGVEKRKVYEALHESPAPLAPKEIVDKKHMIPSTVRNSLREGVRKGDVVAKDGKYELTEIGAALLDSVAKAA